MRITEPSKERSVKDNVMKNANELQNLLAQTSSGKRVSKPSDDPIASVKIQDFKTTINHNKTLEKNLDADQLWVDTTENTTQQISDLLVHVKALALKGSNDAMTHEARQSISNEIKGITEHLVNLANTKANNLYIFSGTKTFTKPLRFNSEITKGDSGYSGLYLKSKTKFPPINQSKPLPLIQPRNTNANNPYQFSLVLNKRDPLTQEILPQSETNQPIQLDIPLQGNESIRDLIDKINLKAIEQNNFKENPQSPIGFDVNFFADINKNNELSLFVSPSWDITPGKNDPAGVNNILQLFLPGTEIPTQSTSQTTDIYNQNLLRAMGIKASFKGYSNEKYLINILHPGTYGTARYVVSDNGGKTWSQPKTLNNKIEVSNPDGKASRKVFLTFESKQPNPYFIEGMEFLFKGNEYASYQGNEQEKSVILDNEVKLPINTNGLDLFFEKNDKDRLNVFETLYGLQLALNKDDSKNVNKSLDELDKSINQVLHQREQIGKTARELQNSKLRVQQSSDLAAEGLSKEEDLDVAKASMEINNAENRHQIALNTSAKLIQPTLLNFLR